MSSHTPAVLVPFVPKPVVSQYLGVKIVRLKGRMMDVRFRAFEEEKAVMVNQLFASLETVEDYHVLAV